jgi:hypothetical protein
VHAGYVLASIVVLPLVLTVARATEQPAPTTELDPAASQVRGPRSGPHSTAEPPCPPGSTRNQGSAGGPVATKPPGTRWWRTWAALPSRWSPSEWAVPADQPRRNRDYGRRRTTHG